MRQISCKDCQHRKNEINSICLGFCLSMTAMGACGGGCREGGGMVENLPTSHEDHLRQFRNIENLNLVGLINKKKSILNFSLFDYYVKKSMTDYFDQVKIKK